MYARLLFVVVGILGAVLDSGCFGPFFVSATLSYFGKGALASLEAADIRWRHE
jgi:hypothetical protein